MNESIDGDKILILGTSAPQVDAIRYCQERGLEVHACGHKKIGRGVEVADLFNLIDIKDEDQLIQYCEENDIDYVYSVGSEIALPAANSVSKKLRLPYLIEPEMTDLANDKTIWRKRLGSDFTGNIEFRGIKNKEELSDWKEFPAMMKPADGQGQRGVRKVEDHEEIETYFDDVMDYSGNDKIIIEEYVSGPELSVNAFVIDGELVYVQETDRISFDDFPGGIIKEHHIPSKYTSNDEKLKGKIENVVSESVKKLSIDDGPVYVQLKLEDKKEPKLIEIAPRLDGCHLWRLIKNYCGVDLLDASFRLLFGQKDEAKKALKEESKKSDHKLIFMTEKPDEKVTKEKYDVEDSLFVEWYYEEDEKVREVNGFMEKIGYRITKNDA